MKKFPKILLGVIIICLLFIGFLYVNNDIGVKASNLETDIRKSQKQSLLFSGSSIQTSDFLPEHISYVDSPDYNIRLSAAQNQAQTFH